VKQTHDRWKIVDAEGAALESADDLALAKQRAAELAESSGQVTHVLARHLPHEPGAWRSQIIHTSKPTPADHAERMVEARRLRDERARQLGPAHSRRSDDGVSVNRADAADLGFPAGPSANAQCPKCFGPDEEGHECERLRRNLTHDGHGTCERCGREIDVGTLECAPGEGCAEKGTP